MSDHKSVDDLPLSPEEAVNLIETTLDQDKAEDIVIIPLEGKSDVADFMVIATGRSTRHIQALASHIQYALREKGTRASIEGLEDSEWVLVDTGDIIVHLFPPDVRDFYNLEKLWSFEPQQRSTLAEV